MKIAMLRINLDSNDGGARHLFWLAREFKRLGHDVKIFAQSYDPQRCYPVVSSQFDVRSLPAPKGERGFLNFSFINNLVAVFRIAGMMLKHDFDVINPHEAHAHWAAALYKFRKRTAIVWICSDAWVYLPERLRFLRPPGSSLKRRISAFLVKVVDRVFTRAVDRIVVLDRRMKRLIDGIYRVDSAIVHPGIDHGYLDSLVDPDSRKIVSSKYGFPKDSFLVLSASIVHPYRRFEDTIRAIKVLSVAGPDARLVIVGSPSDKDYVSFLKTTVDSLGLADRVRFDLRFVSDLELARYYQACDCFVFANNEQTWGLGVIEASSFRKACVVSRGAGVHEIYTDGKDALLVDPCAPEQIASKIKLLIDDPELRSRIASSAKSLVRDTISWDIQARQMATLFSEVCKR